MKKQWITLAAAIIVVELIAVLFGYYANYSTEEIRGLAMFAGWASFTIICVAGLVYHQWQLHRASGS